jgi:hypothetical protein
MSFFTAVNCMDGRVQLPVIFYLQKRFGADFIDMITEPGPVAVLAEDPASDTAKSIFDRIAVSIEKHSSLGIALVAHYDCAGNPVSEAVQRKQLRKSMDAVGKVYPDMNIIGLWADVNWTVTEMKFD